MFRGTELHAIIFFHQRIGVSEAAVVIRARNTPTMSLPSIDLSTVIFLFYFIAFLIGSRGLTTHLRDGADAERDLVQRSSSATQHHIL